VSDQRTRSGARQPRVVASLLGLCVCLALVLVAPGPALALSGFDTNQPAVRAQYPDAAAPPATGPPPVVSNLGDVIMVTRKAQHGRKRAVQWHAQQHRIARKATAALSSSVGLGPPQSGSVALLIAGMVVLSVAGVLRWRRGHAQSYRAVD
jgi:hypothetical protein